MTAPAVLGLSARLASTVDISGIIGIARSIKTGFTNTAKLHYTFPTARQVGGWQDYPPGTPYRLVH